MKKLKTKFVFIIMSVFALNFIFLIHNFFSEKSFCASISISKPIKSVIRVGIDENKNEVGIDTGKTLKVLKVDKFGSQTPWFTVFNIKNVKIIPSRIHIKIGKSFQKRSDAAGELSHALKIFPAAFIGFNDGWNIYTGNFSSEESGRLKINELTKKYKHIKYNLSLREPGGGDVDVVDSYGTIFSYDTRKINVTFASSDKKYVSCKNANSRRYRGSIGIERKGSKGLSVINYVYIEDYLKSVLTKEVYPDWPIEALKAQAVAARSYAVSCFGKHKSSGYDVCDGVCCQVYGGLDAENPSSKYDDKPNKAVYATRGIVISHDGKVACAQFHSNSGGYLENAEDVWYSSTPYLRGKKDPYSMFPNVKERFWSKVFSYDELENMLQPSGDGVGRIYSVNVTRMSSNDHVMALTFTGSQGSSTLKKERIRSVLGFTNIKTTRFSVKTANAGIVDGRQALFTGNGNGHSVGMSQWGAYSMAKNFKKKYRDILRFYYTNVKISRIKYR